MILHIDKVRFSRLAMTSAVMSMLFLSGCAAFNKPVEQPVKSDYEIAIEKELDAAIKRVAAQPRWSATRLIAARSEEHTSELQSLMRISYAVFCLKKKKSTPQRTTSSL